MPLTVRRLRILRFLSAFLVAACIFRNGAAFDGLSPECNVGKAVFDIAWKANIRVGFEALPGCIPTSRERPRPIAGQSLGTASPRELLNNLMTTAPKFSWRVIDDVFVVRPRSAWGNHSDPLNFRTGSFRIAGTDLDSALRILIQHVSPTVYAPYTVVQTPVGSISATFPGGSMMDALNALIGEGRFNEWEIGYPGQVMVVVRSHDLRAGAAMAPLNAQFPTR